jgi:hypothetical protein
MGLVNVISCLIELTHQGNHQTAKRLSIAALIALLYSACANVLPLEGGDKDTFPPKLDSLRSTKNFQTRFKKQTIDLNFNEWIKLDRPEQIIVSPPLEKKLDLQLKGKGLRIKLHEDEVLKTNTTYTINFGESIKDITEDNKADMRFVFSTGDKIDSLSARFVVKDALTNQPLENVLVMLYEAQEDSVVSKSRPFYFATTQKQGTATIENIRKGQFKVFALIDGNLNYKYDLTTEKIGFIEPLVNLTFKNSTDSSIMLTLFQPQLPLSIKEKKTDDYGVVKLVYTQNADMQQPTWEDIGQKVQIEHLGDSLKIWYHQDNNQNWRIFALKDTILVKNSLKDKENFTKNGKLRLKGSTAQRGAKRTIAAQPLASNKPLLLEFNYPITMIDTSKIRIQDDTTKAISPILSFNKDTLHPQQLRFNIKWLENHAYTLNALPGAFTSIYGFINDSITVKTAIAPKRLFGDILLKYTGLDPNNQYIIQLWLDNGSMIQEQIVSGKSQGDIQYITLSPSFYKIQIVTDRNRNGRWDSGNYYEKRQPELIFAKKLDELKPNWTLEAEVELK